MPRKALPFDPDDLVASYRRGESLTSIGKRYHCNPRKIRDFLKGAGIPIKPAEHSLPDAEIVARYQAGQSVLSLAAAYGVERIVIDKRLSRAGVQRRGGSEANRLRMARLSPSERAILTAKAHDAVRGKPRTIDELNRRAIIHQANGQYIGRFEPDLMALLRARGHDPIPQMAAGRYNIDIAIPPVAVEVHNQAAMPLAATYNRQRLVDLLKGDWTVIYVWMDRYAVNPLTPRAADYIHAVFERTERDPAFRGSYWVIRGTGHHVTVGRLNRDNFALIPAPVNPLDYAHWPNVD